MHTLFKGKSLDFPISRIFGVGRGVLDPPQLERAAEDVGPYLSIRLTENGCVFQWWIARKK
jgi:hypothetical protein